jgi:class 3 adenylate cyclase
VADSLFDILDKNPNDTIAFKEINNVIGSLFYQDADLAMFYANKEYRFAVKANNKYAQGKALLNIGIIYDLQGNYDAALYNYDEALKVANQFQLDKLKGDIYNNFSITLAVLGNMEESISNALKALAIYNKINDSTLMAKIYNNLGARYSEMEYYDEALSYYQKAAEINEQLKDNKKLAFNYGNIGLLYYDLIQNEKALEYFQRSIALHDTINDKFNFSIALHNLALVYLRMSQFEKALENERRAYEIASEIHDELGKISALNGIAAIHKEMGRKNEAMKYFKQSEAIAEELGARYYLIKIYEEIANLYAKLNDYENAFVYNKKFNTLKDSIMTTEKNKALQKVNEYENKKKEQEIQILTKDSEIQKLNIKRQKLIRNSVAVVGILFLLLAAGLFHRYRFVRNTRNELSEKNKIINKEKERSDELLLNILPAETAEELKNSGKSKARHFDLVTVMFTDFKGFTYMAEQLSPQELVDEIDYCFKHFDQIISKYNIEKIKTIGDAYMCAGGLPVANDTNPMDVVSAGLEIQQFMVDLKIQRKAENKPYFDLRLGINTGPVVAGIVGIKKFQYDIWGDTVNIASRMESSGEVGKVNISQMTYDKIKHQFNCEHRGKIEAKNKGAIDMYFVTPETA